jgi:hypothetical protein
MARLKKLAVNLYPYDGRLSANSGLSCTLTLRYAVAFISGRLLAVKPKYCHVFCKKFLVTRRVKIVSKRSLIAPGHLRTVNAGKEKDEPD